MHMRFVVHAARIGLVALLLPGVFGSAEAQPAPLVLGLSVDGSADALLVPGRPSVVVAHLFHAAAFTAGAAPVTAAPVGGAWSRTFTLAVEDGAGRAVAWAFEAAPGPTGPVTVTAEEGAAWAWTLDAASTAALTPGTYVLRLTLAGAAFGGPDLVAPAVRVIVAPPTGGGPPEAAAERLRAADVAVARGDRAAALQALDALVVEDPYHVAARVRQALLLQEERPVEALRVLQYAVEGAVDAASGGRSEPPAMLFALQDALVHAVEAATAFAVSFGDKPPAHPFAGIGSAQAFALDGIAGRELVLRRGVAYTFRAVDVPARAPFTITLDPAGTQPYLDGVQGAPAVEGGALTFTPGAEAPSVLYYGSDAAPYAGWRLLIDDRGQPTPVEPEHPGRSLGFAAPAPNPTGGSFRIALDAPPGALVRVEAFDVLGRRVAVLHDGAAPAGGLDLGVDASAWPPGVYVLRAATGAVVAVHRLTVVR